MATEVKVVRYTLTRRDLFVFQCRGAVQNRILQVMTVLFILIFAHLGFHTPPQTGQRELSLAVKIAVASTMGLLVVVGMFVLQLLVVFLTVWGNKFKGLLGDHELTLSEAGMSTRSAHSESARKWTGLLKLASTDKYLYLYVNETMAQIVPKRYFASQIEAQGFEQMIRERMKVD